MPTRTNTTWSIIEEKVEQGIRLNEEDAIFLFETPSLLRLGQLADRVNREKNGLDVFYNVNRHINPTNICVMTCKFCAYSRKPGEEGAYEFSIEEMVSKAKEAADAGATELHIVGGLHPRWRFEYFKEMLQAIKAAFPSLHIKGFTAVEIDWLAKKARKSIKETLLELREAGLDSLPGGGAEVFHQDVRDEITAKLTSDEWLSIHKTAHDLGMKSNCTMLYGHVESYAHRAHHLNLLRKLQDETHGFNAFIPLSFQPHQNDMGITRYTFGADDLKMIAVSRLFLDNFSHIKSYWIMSGQDIAQLALQFGANDLDGTVVEEKISKMAGGRAGMSLSKVNLQSMILRSGKNAVERDTLYHPLDSILAPETEILSESILSKLKASKYSPWEKEELIALGRSDIFHELGIAAQTARGHRNAFVGFATTIAMKPLLDVVSSMQRVHEAIAMNSGAHTSTLVLDLAGFGKLDLSLSLDGLLEVISQIRRDYPQLRVVLASLKGFWYLAQQSHVEFKDAVFELVELGVDTLETSHLETESSLTHSEVKELHLNAHSVGMKTAGKIELAVPPGRGRPLWQSFVERLMVYREIQDATQGILTVNIEPSKGAQVLAVEYLRAVAIARLGLPQRAQISTPLLKIPTMSLAKGEGSSFTQHPSEKIIALSIQMGSSDLGLIPSLAVSDKIIMQEIRSSGFNGKIRNAKWEVISELEGNSFAGLKHLPTQMI
jgi:aminodeoxyfutalosine synthase